MSPAFHIRGARPEEQAAIRELTLAAYEEFAGIMAPTAWAALRSVLHNTLDGEHNAEWIVAEHDERLVGSVLLSPPTLGAYGGALDETVWPEIRLLAVAPTLRGQGVAKALVAECERRARASGASTIGLHTSASLRAAIRLYEQLGYQRAPEYDFQPLGAELVTAYRKAL